MAQGSETESRVWLVTGCSAGLGREIARAVLAAGDRLVATARRAGDLDGWLTADPARCRRVALDVTDPSSRAEAVAAAVAAWGGIDVLVNNAGAGLLGAVESCDEAAVRQCFEANFFGPLALTRSLLPVLRSRAPAAHVVQVGAVATHGNYPGFGPYGAAKAAWEALSESLRAELLGLGVRVTVVEPGPLRTGFARKVLAAEGASDPVYGRTVGRFGATLRALDGRQPGDPRAVAELLVRLVREGRAPFRLPVGQYAIRKLRSRAAELERAAAEWETAAAACDVPPVT